MSIEVTAISLGALGVRLFGDVGVSRSALGRLGLREAIRSARRAEYDVLIVEHVDRISKDLVDIVDVFEILCDLRIRIYAVHGGYLDLDTLSSCDVPPLYDRLPLRARRRTSRPRTIMGAES